MNTYEVRFIRAANDDDTKNVVIDVQALSHVEALQAARDQASKQLGWLADYGFYSVAVTRYG